MIDWHSHVLPGMDDGSRSVEESLAMLRALGADGVSLVMATPHFYANEESVDSFLERRQACLDALLQAREEGMPEVRVGAEVKYYPGISKMKELDRLTVEGSRILLLEMPMTRWTEYTVKELLSLAAARSLTVVLAHVDRYLGLQRRGTLERLCEEGVLMQVNAGSLESFSTRRRVLSLLDAGLVQFLGSDCHNLTTRPPRLAGAYRRISKKFGDRYIHEMAAFGHRILARNTKQRDASASP